MELTDRIWHLMARALNAEASSQELEELSGHLAMDEGLQQQFEILSRIWNDRKEAASDPESDADSTVAKIISRADAELILEEADNSRRRQRRRRNRVLAVTASVLILLSAGWYFSGFTRNAGGDLLLENVPEAIVAKKGSRIRSLLPDGTVVWLNAGSRLFYETDFTGPTREVKLEGEAYFDVNKQPDRPFIVHTGGVDIRVLGTAFNVKSYPEDKTVETTLFRGKVEVLREKASLASAISLKPNEKLVVIKEAAIDAPILSTNNKPQTAISETSFRLTTIDTTKKENERFETAWLYSRLEFRGDSFEELALKLERWYNVTIRFTDEKVKQLNFNGSFERETVDQAFKALQAAVPFFKYNIHNDEISVESSQ